MPLRVYNVFLVASHFGLVSPEFPPKFVGWSMYLCPGVPSETVKYQERHCSPNVLQVTETRRCRTTQLVAVAGTNPTKKLGQRAGRLRRGRHYLRRQALAELTSRGRWVVGVRRFGRSKSVARRAPSGHFKAGCLFLKKKRFRLHGVAPKGPLFPLCSVATCLALAVSPSQKPSSIETNRSHAKPLSVQWSGARN
jgi:hypothetical protein